MLAGIRGLLFFSVSHMRPSLLWVKKRKEKQLTDGKKFDGEGIIVRNSGIPIILKKMEDIKVIEEDDGKVLFSKKHPKLPRNCKSLVE